MAQSPKVMILPPAGCFTMARPACWQQRKVPSVLAHGLLTLEAAVILSTGAWIYSLRAPRVPEYL